MYVLVLHYTTCMLVSSSRLRSTTCVVLCGNVGKVGKKIPLATLWVEVAKGITFADTVRRGGIMCAV